LEEPINVTVVDNFSPKMEKKSATLSKNIAIYIIVTLYLSTKAIFRRRMVKIAEKNDRNIDLRTRKNVSFDKCFAHHVFGC
jgi:hypothetical protein